jgi:uncharacterized protein (TIGR00251 family)
VRPQRLLASAASHGSVTAAATKSRIFAKLLADSPRRLVQSQRREDPAVLVVRVQAPAVDGKANDAVVAAMADVLGVSKSDVRVVAGQTSRTKTLEIAGITAAEVGNLLDR